MRLNCYVRSTYPSSISLWTTGFEDSVTAACNNGAGGFEQDTVIHKILDFTPCGFFNYTLRSNDVRLNCYVRSTYPSSISLWTTGFEDSVTAACNNGAGGFAGHCDTQNT